LAILKGKFQREPFFPGSFPSQSPTFRGKGHRNFIMIFNQNSRDQQATFRSGVMRKLVTMFENGLVIQIG